MNKPVIVLIGSENTGKTTLCEQLSRHYGIDFNPEYARTYAEEVGRDLTEKDVIEIAKGQLKSEADYMERNTGPFHLLDTCIISTLIYSKLYYNWIPPELPGMIDLSRYNHFLFMAPGLAWVDDGIRKKPKEEWAMHEFFERELKALNISPHLIKNENSNSLESCLAYIESIVI